MRDVYKLRGNLGRKEQQSTCRKRLVLKTSRSGKIRNTMRGKGPYSFIKSRLLHTLANISSLLTWGEIRRISPAIASFTIASTRGCTLYPFSFRLEMSARRKPEACWVSRHPQNGFDETMENTAGGRKKKKVQKHGPGVRNHADWTGLLGEAEVRLEPLGEGHDPVQSVMVCFSHCPLHNDKP